MRWLKYCLILIVFTTLFNCGKDKPSAPSIPDPIASFTESGGTVAPATITFQNTSQNADTYLWRFGDGDSTNLSSPEHIFNTHGTYSVTLVASNSQTGKSANKIKQFTIAPSTVSIESIRIDAIPFTDQYGAGWDLGSGPDVYVNIADASNIVFTVDTYYLDVSPSDLPLQWTLSQPFQIPNWATAYFVRVYDYDDFSNDDYIGSSNGFRINDVVASDGYASTVSRQNASGSIRVVISLTWQ